MAVMIAVSDHCLRTTLLEPLQRRAVIRGVLVVEAPRALSMLGSSLDVLTRV